MSPTRRDLLRAGGGLIALLPWGGWPEARAADVVEIKMQGRPDGSHVWFDPIGVRIRPGQTVRWVNRDPGNSHTATAYHPANFDRPRRMPAEAAPWHSDYLLPGESFAVTLTARGVYDYFCIPHELAGMVGRIVVDAPEASGWMQSADSAGDLPEEVLRAFPAVEEIMRAGIVRHA